MNSPQPNCVVCERDSSQVPLIQMLFKGEQTWICPQHLPILIHKPAQLASRLPGIEKLGPAEGHGHE